MDNLTKLRYWTFKILPLVYDDSLSYYEVLTKVTNKVNELVDSNNTMPQAITDEITKQLDESYATNINNKIDSAVNTVTENANNQIDKLANEVYAKFISAIATDEGTNTFTKDAKSGGELIFLNGTLYKVTAVMPAGTNYIIGTNIVTVDISKELKDIKETYLTSNNEHWNDRSTNDYNTGVYLYWKDILYVTTKDIKTNDILYADSENQNLKQITLASEITNIQKQIYKNDNDIDNLQKNLAQEILRATNRENIIDGRISNIVAQSGNDNTEIVDARIGYDGTRYDTLGTSIRTQVSDLKSATSQQTVNYEKTIDTMNLYEKWEQVSIGEPTKGSYLSVSNGKIVETPATDTIYGYYEVDVTPGDVMSICSLQYELACAFIFADDNWNAIISSSTSSTNDYVPRYIKTTVPKGATKLYLLWSSAKRTIHDTNISAYANQLFIKVLKLVGRSVNLILPEPCFELEGYFGSRRSINAKIITTEAYSTCTLKGYPVKTGEKVYIKGQERYDIPVYILTDEKLLVTNVSSTSYVDPPYYAEYVLTIENDGFIWIHDLAGFPTSIFFYDSIRNAPNRKWIAIGDSLTDESTLSGKPNYVDFVAAHLGLVANNMGVGGTGFWNGGNYTQGTNTFYSRALTVPTDADIITVFGSFNDLYANAPAGIIPTFGTAEDTGTNTLGGCMASTIINLRATCPNAIVLFIAPTPWASQNNVSGYQEWASGWAERYVTLLENVCKKYNIPFLDLYHYGGFAPWVQAIREAYTLGGDGTHPNTSGHVKYIAPLISAKMEDLL